MPTRSRGQTERQATATEIVLLGSAPGAGVRKSTNPPLTLAPITATTGFLGDSSAWDRHGVGVAARPRSRVRINPRFRSTRRWQGADVTVGSPSVAVGKSRVRRAECHHSRGRPAPPITTDKTARNPASMGASENSTYQITAMSGLLDCRPSPTNRGWFSSCRRLSAAASMRSSANHARPRWTTQPSPLSISSTTSA